MPGNARKAFSQESQTPSTKIPDIRSPEWLDDRRMHFGDHNGLHVCGPCMLCGVEQPYDQKPKGRLPRL